MLENEKNSNDFLDFWKSHRNKIAQLYIDSPTADNLQWLKNVDARIEKIANGNTHEKVASKANFGDVLQGKGKARKK
jgi:hypothetical protein